jgi:hypothetical protein
MDLRAIFLLIGTVATLIRGAYLISKFWKDIREKVAGWLRNRGLQKSALMDAWIVLDNLVTTVRCTIFVKTQTTVTQKVSETTYSRDEIRQKDPDVYAELQKRGNLETNIMDLFQ